MVPLALLEALRDHDLPSEVLEDENFQASLPRRFGLSDVVFTQIRRLEDDVRKGNGVTLSEARDLMRLVLRRPDAPAVLREAGSAIARRDFERRRRPAARRVKGHGLPRAVVYFSVRRAAKRLMTRLFGRGSLSWIGRPLHARIRHPFMDGDTEAGTPCVMFSAMLEELLLRYTHRKARVAHSHCIARGADACEWELEPE